MVCSVAPLDMQAPLLELNCAIGVVLRHCFSILFEFQVIRKGCEGSDAESWLVLQWRKFKREMWRSCFRKTLCGLPWNVTRDVDLFLQCPSQVGAESSLSQARRLGEKVVIAELGDWDMHAEHKQYIFKAITKTFDKPESLAISTISQKHLYQRFIKVS